MTILWYSKNYSIEDYNVDCFQGNVEHLSDFIYGRFYERYIQPFEKMDAETKNGFSIMAIACLMIESLENFWQGKKETPQYKGNDFFESFFSRCLEINNDLSNFKGLKFYKHIRCGILNQAETTGGWIIRRVGPLLQKEAKVINATRFLEQLKIYLEWYKEELKKREFKTDELWKNFRRKMTQVKKNCRIIGNNDSEIY